MSKKKKHIRLFIQLAVSALCLFLVLRSAKLAVLLTTLSTITISTAAGLVLIYVLGQVLSAVKWQVIIRASGLNRKFSNVIEAYFLGMFFNAFGFGTVSGDVARALALKPAKGERAGAFATVLADRILGLVVLLSIGAVFLLFVHPPRLGSFAVPLAFGVILAMAIGWWLGPTLLRRIIPREHKFADAAQRAADAFPQRLDTLTTASFLSVVFHLSQIYMHFLIARELGANLSFAYLCATVPIVNFISSLPFSINGVGVREALYVFFFTSQGVPQETAVAFGAIWVVAVTLVSLGGFLVLNHLIPEDIEKVTDEVQAEAKDREQIQDRKRAVG